MAGHIESSKTIKAFNTLGKAHRIEILTLMESQPIKGYDVYKILARKNPKLYLSLIDRAMKELAAAGLACRDKEKRYQATAFGVYILNVFEGINADVIEYLRNKKFALPKEFLSDIPSIVKNSTALKGMVVFENYLKIQEIVKKEVLLFLSAPTISNTNLENNLKIVKRGVKFRALISKSLYDAYLDVDSMGKKIDRELLERHNKTVLLGQTKYDVKSKVTQKVPMNLYIADREIMLLGLPDSGGDIEILNIIISSDPGMIEWGVKVFNYYWKKS